MSNTVDELKSRHTPVIWTDCWNLCGMFTGTSPSKDLLNRDIDHVSLPPVTGRRSSRRPYRPQP